MAHHPSLLMRLAIGRTRLVVSIIIGVLTIALLPDTLRLNTRFVIGWDIFAGLYVLMTGLLILNSTISFCRHGAALNDEGDGVILLMTVLGAGTSFFAIISELAASKAAGQSIMMTFIFTAVTVLVSWMFTHVTFALHYANLFYRSDARGEHGGLLFPGNREPDYRDFLYYSFVIACAAQTADVSTLSPAMRHVTLIHCVTAFAFNSAILALMINITASLMG